MSKPYKIEFTPDEAQAIFWHGGRYHVSEFIERHGHETDDEKGWVMELEENQAWVLRDLWEDEGVLACGSESLNAKIQAFIDQII
jgi:hypothetical protein